MITIEQAHEMGAKGGPIDAHERLLFEAWMAGHCWHCGDWIATDEDDGYYDLASTRVIWAAWRDRAALTPPTPQMKPITEPISTLMFERMQADPRTAPFSSKNWFEAGIVAAEAFHDRSEVA